MDGATISLAAGRKPLRDKHDIIGQNMFRRVVMRAVSRGMVVNSDGSCWRLRWMSGGIGEPSTDAWLPL